MSSNRARAITRTATTCAALLSAWATGVLLVNARTAAPYDQAVQLSWLGVAIVAALGAVAGLLLQVLLELGDRLEDAYDAGVRNAVDGMTVALNSDSAAPLRRAGMTPDE